ncbi:ANXA3 protein, partial [Polyodon spathula]|nr:annexin A3-like [Polyodon spathula]MBN3271150.1 ANXA3 protein [Polyodon spathula]
MASVWAGQRGTIKAYSNFSAAADVKALRNAIEGIGTTESVVIDTITQRSNAQRQIILKEYKEATGRNLIDDLKGDLCGDFENVMVGLMMHPAAFDASKIKGALKGPGTTESTLIEILASRTNLQIKELAEAYQAENQRSLTDDLTSDISGEFGKAMLILLQGKRDESINFNQEQAKVDAKALYDAGEKKWGTDESKFIDILCKRSIPQLRKTFDEYKIVSKTNIVESIKGEMSGNLEDLLVAVVKCVVNTPAYFAERLYKSMTGGGTDEATLSRIMISRSEIDLLDIRAEYKKLFGYSLHSSIKSEVSGDYCTCLLKICGDED